MDDARAKSDVAPVKANVEEKIQATPAKQRQEEARTRSDDGEIAPMTPERAMTPRVITTEPIQDEHSDDLPLTQAGGAESQDIAEA
jgi:hypothetical protein